MRQFRATEMADDIAAIKGNLKTLSAAVAASTRASVNAMPGTEVEGCRR